MNLICQYLLVALIVTACISWQCLCSSEDLMVASLTETYCEKPPKVSKFKLLECCSVPRLFKNELKEKCVAECSNGTTKGNPWCCMTKCTLEETGIAVNGVIDNIQAKNVFKTLFANSTDAMKHSDEIIDKCANDSFASQNDTQKDECEHPEYAKLLTCVHREFFRNCLRQSPEASCKKIKDFVKKCPANRDLLFES